MLVRFAYLAVSQAFAALRLLPIGDREKDVEILALRHQLSVLQRQLGDERPRFRPEDRAFLAALLSGTPRHVLRRIRLLVSPDTVLRWHRDLIRRRHARASARRRPGRPRTVVSVRRLVLRLARENPSWGYRRIHGQLAVLGIRVAPSTFWEILKAEGIDPAPNRSSVTWPSFLRSQAEAILAMDFIETVTLNGQRQFILAAIHHASRRIRILGTTAHPTHAWVTQAVRNLLMDLEDADQLATVRFLIRDRDAKYPAMMNQILQHSGIAPVLTGVQVPRMNAVMERWVRTLRTELLDRTLIWNEAHLGRALRTYERHYNQHRPHRALAGAAPMQALPRPLSPHQIERLDIRRHDRLGGVLHEYRHAA
ncbi:integrase [Streptacidiphilus pinicola]|uniref:Integrase n=1 Tax=Streptacidiphilus pinicola TaxID=2219663 RepID=A0A2X0IT67_9ACTN|nr:integrase core domain-containing protein [Streptacidiphilus pinicola]RAG80756.1 integrase [Streptacidiphilus pinicola]